MAITYTLVINSPLQSIHKRNLSLAKLQGLVKEYDGCDFNVYPSCGSTSVQLTHHTDTINIETVVENSKTERIATYDRPTKWLAQRRCSPVILEVVNALLWMTMTGSKLSQQSKKS